MAIDVKRCMAASYNTVNTDNAFIYSRDGFLCMFTV